MGAFKRHMVKDLSPCMQANLSVQQSTCITHPHHVLSGCKHLLRPASCAALVLHSSIP